MAGYSTETGYATRRRSARSLISLISVIALIGLGLGLVIGFTVCGAVDPVSGLLVIASVVWAYLWTRLFLAAVTLLADIHEMTEARGV